MTEHEQKIACAIKRGEHVREGGDDALRLVVERERAAVVTWLRQVDEIVPEWPPLDPAALLVWERGRQMADAAKIFADAIERGEHVREGGDDA